MLKKIALLFSLIISVACFAQKNQNKIIKVNDTEFIVSGILFGGGTLSIATGLLSKAGNAIVQGAVRDNSPNTAGNTFLIAGGMSMIAGTVLFFDARAKQRRRYALSVEGMNYPNFFNGRIYLQKIPSLCLSISMNK